MKPKKSPCRIAGAPFNRDEFAALPGPAFNVVVYRHPGPDDRVIETHAQSVAESSPVGKPGGAFATITLVESDFDWLWGGVSRGDLFGTAYGVLGLLGPAAAQFIGRRDDFIFGWIGGTDRHYGDVLLLQIIPRPHLLAMMN